MFLIGLVLGLVIGGFLGMLIVALGAIAAQSDAAAKSGRPDLRSIDGGQS